MKTSKPIIFYPAAILGLILIMSGCTSRNETGGGQAASVAESNQGKDTPKKSLVIVGKPNPKSISADDKMPPMNDRPAALKPGGLPPRVRYVFEPDATVVAAAQRLEKYLADGNTGEGAIFKDDLLVFSGAWKIAKSSTQFEKTDAKIMKSMIPISGKVLTLEGCFMQKAEEVNKLGEYIRQLLQNDGGASVRALNSMEMGKWWMFIPFAIEEPIFAVESKGGKYVFIFSFSSESPAPLSLIDELNTLPDAYDMRSSTLKK